MSLPSRAARPNQTSSPTVGQNETAGYDANCFGPLTTPALFLSEAGRSFVVTVELVANWTPLTSRLAPELCAEFMWMYRDNGVEHYKHIVTRRCLRLEQSKSNAVAA